MSKPVFTYENFINFCKSKDPKEVYDYSDPSECACAQYAATIGMTFQEACAKSFAFRMFNDLAGDASWGNYISTHKGFRREGTFGKLTVRLENLVRNEVRLENLVRNEELMK